MTWQRFRSPGNRWKHSQSSVSFYNVWFRLSSAMRVLSPERAIRTEPEWPSRASDPSHSVAMPACVSGESRNPGNSPGGLAQGLGQSLHDLGKPGEVERLRPIGKSALRARVNFDDEAIGAHGDCGAGDSRNQALLAGSMRWVGDHGQVREIASQGDGSKIEGVPHFGLEGFDSPLTEHDLLVAAGKQILRGQEPFLDRGGGATFQQNRFIDGSEAAQQSKVLHVARTNLEHVDVLTDDVGILSTHHLGDHGQAGFLLGFAQNLQRFDAETLEIVGRSPRLISAAAQHGSSCLLDGMSGLEKLLARFHRAWTSDDDDLRAADGDAVDLDDGTFRSYLPADE